MRPPGARSPHTHMRTGTCARKHRSLHTRMGTRDPACRCGMHMRCTQARARAVGRERRRDRRLESAADARLPGRRLDGARRLPLQRRAARVNTSETQGHWRRALVCRPPLPPSCRNVAPAASEKHTGKRTGASAHNACSLNTAGGLGGTHCFPCPHICPRLLWRPPPRPQARLRRAAWGVREPNVTVSPDEAGVDRET